MSNSTFLELLLRDPQAVIFFIFAIVVALAIALLSRRIGNLSRGGDGKSLEGTIRTLHERVAALEENARKTASSLSNHEARITRAIQGVSVKRFDPFQNAGGQQSFATALLNEKGDGVVISGIHARDGVRVYAKQVKDFKSERELSEEEAGAIEESKRTIS